MSAWRRERRCRGAEGIAVAAVALMVSAWPAGADPLGSFNAHNLFVLLTIEVLVLIEIGIVIAEAVAYRYALPLNGWRALATSLIANLASFLAGICLWPWLAHSHLSRFLVFPFLAMLAVIVEWPVVVVLNLRFPDRRRLGLTTAIANLCSYPAGASLFYALTAQLWK